MNIADEVRRGFEKIFMWFTCNELRGGLGKNTIKTLLLVERYRLSHFQGRMCRRSLQRYRAALLLGLEGKRT
jgi:hypothetical protein